MQIICNFFEKFWWWIQKQENDDLHIQAKIELETKLLQSQISTVLFNSYPEKQIKNRKRRNLAINLDEYILNVYSLIQKKSFKFFQGYSKRGSSVHPSPKARSSVFIGVSKNGDNWQVLINCGKSKKYVGTFTSEKEAAIMYDFYAICLHLSKAKTNFTYDAALISEMIDSYLSNSKKFVPSLFMNRFE